MHTIGTCGHCGGPVQMPECWSGLVPPPTCALCGATAKQDRGLPVMPMNPILFISPQAPRRLDGLGTDGCEVGLGSMRPNLC